MKVPSSEWAPTIDTSVPVAAPHREGRVRLRLHSKQHQHDRCRAVLWSVRKQVIRLARSCPFYYQIFIDDPLIIQNYTSTSHHTLFNDYQPRMADQRQQPRTNYLDQQLWSVVRPGRYVLNLAQRKHTIDNPSENDVFFV